MRIHSNVGSQPVTKQASCVHDLDNIFHLLSQDSLHHTGTNSFGQAQNNSMPLDPPATSRLLLGSNRLKVCNAVLHLKVKLSHKS